MPERLPDKPSSYTRHVLVAIGLAVLALLLWKIAPVLMLFFAGVVMAAALRAGSEPLARRFGIGEVWAVGIVSLLVLAAFAGGSYFFGQRIASETQQMVSAIGEAGEKVREYVSRAPLGESIVESLEGGGGEETMAKVAKGTFTVFGALADVFLVIFLAVYLAADPRTYRAGFLLLLPPAARDRVGNALDTAGMALRKWLLGQLVAMVAVGVITGIGLWAIGVPMALPLAILSGLLEFVPVVGPLVAAIPGILIAFTVAPEVAFYAALVYLGVQFVEGNFVMPLAQKWAVSLPPALSLLGIVAFGLLFGFMGVLFAMPLLVVAVTLVNKLYVERMDPAVPAVESDPAEIPKGPRKK